MTPDDSGSTAAMPRYAWHRRVFLAGGWLIAAVGLAGKVLGPAGLAVQIIWGGWPPSSAVGVR